MKLVAGDFQTTAAIFLEKEIVRISVNAICTLPSDDWIAPVIGVIGRLVSMLI
jgi:hypothetical protein